MLKIAETVQFTRRHCERGDAIHFACRCLKGGLLTRFAPRNDEAFFMALVTIQTVLLRQNIEHNHNTAITLRQPFNATIPAYFCAD